jgi:glutamyl-tRNA synthetase
LDWDEGPDSGAEDPYAPEAQRGGAGPYFQSQRLPVYREHADRLLASGRAYEDEGAVRLRMGEDVAFEDAVYGHIEVRGPELEDFVVLKSDGYPTYHLAVVVDDALMGVTHVLRGQEHLYNTPKHVALQEALGLPRPVFAHLPSILNQDGSKMSKRDKAKAARRAAETERARIVEIAGRVVGASRVEAFLSKQTDDVAVAEAVAGAAGASLPEIEVADFQRSGYLPETLCNYLALLGWSPADGVERFGLDGLVAGFAFDRVGRKSARFDREKLFRFDGDDIAAMAPEVFRRRWRAHCEAFERVYVERVDEHGFARLAAAYHPRSRTLQEPCDLARFFVADDDAIVYDPKAVAKWLRKGDGLGRALLGGLRPLLAAREPFAADAIEGLLKAFAEERDLGMGKVAQPLRVAVSGAAVSPGIGETLAILGRERVLARIDRCVAATADG